VRYRTQLPRMGLTDMLAYSCGEMRNQEPVMSTKKDYILRM
jgi:hypothetical protein